MSWEFRSDSVVRLVRNDTLVSSSRFRVAREARGTPGDSVNRLFLDGAATILTLEMPTPDRLVATEQCADCFTFTWNRQR
jgi:hypothetical protein